jgi:hypothetical protein
VHAVHVAPEGEADRTLGRRRGQVERGQVQYGCVPRVEVCRLRVHVVAGGDVGAEGVVPVGAGREAGGRPREPRPREPVGSISEGSAARVVRLKRTLVQQRVRGGGLGVERVQQSAAQQQQQSAALCLHVVALGARFER